MVVVLVVVAVVVAMAVVAMAAAAEDLDYLAGTTSLFFLSFGWLVLVLVLVDQNFNNNSLLSFHSFVRSRAFDWHESTVRYNRGDYNN